MRVSRRPSNSVSGGAVVGLVLMGLSCQALVDVSQYRFDRDGGVDTASSSPPGSSELAEPADDATNADAGHHGAAVSEQLPSPPSFDPEHPVDAGTELDSSGAEDPPDLPPEEPELEPDPGPPPSEPVPDPPDPEPVPDPPPADPPRDPVNGCSEVEFCRAYEVLDTTDEERCIQRGCSVNAAAAECRDEVLFYCGAVQPPFALYTLDGGRLELQ